MDKMPTEAGEGSGQVGELCALMLATENGAKAICPSFYATFKDILSGFVSGKLISVKEATTKSGGLRTALDYEK